MSSGTASLKFWTERAENIEWLDDVRVHLDSGSRWCVVSSRPALVWGVHTMVLIDNCCQPGDWDPYMAGENY